MKTFYRLILVVIGLTGCTHGRLDGELYKSGLGYPSEPAFSISTGGHAMEKSTMLTPRYVYWRILPGKYASAVTKEYKILYIFWPDGYVMQATTSGPLTVSHLNTVWADVGHYAMSDGINIEMEFYVWHGGDLEYRYEKQRASLSNEGLIIHPAPKQIEAGWPPDVPYARELLEDNVIRKRWPGNALVGAPPVDAEPPAPKP